MRHRARSDLVALVLGAAGCATSQPRSLDLDSIEPAARPEPFARVRTIAIQHHVRAKKKVYTGVRVDVTFRDADLHNALRFLVEFGGMNLVGDGGMSGQVTLRLRNLPWDQVLDAILQLHHLELREERGIFIVARS